MKKLLFLILFLPFFVSAQNIQKGYIEDVEIKNNQLRVRAEFKNIDEAEGIQWLVSDIKKEEIFARSFVSFSSGIEENKNEVLLEIPSEASGELLVTADLLGDESRVGIAQSRFIHKSRESSWGGVSGLRFFADEEGGLLQGQIFSNEDRDRLDIQITFYQKNLQGKKFIEYSQSILNIKEGIETPLKFEFSGLLSAQNYWASIQFSENGEDLGGEFIFPFTLEGDGFAKITNITPKKGEILTQDSLLFFAEGLASSNRKLLAEIVWMEEGMLRQELILEVQPSDDGRFKLETGIKLLSSKSSKLNLSLVLKDFGTGVVLGESLQKWNVETPVEIAGFQTEIMQKSWKYKDALIRFGLLLLVLLGFCFYRKKVHMIFLILLLGGNVLAVNSKFEMIFYESKKGIIQKHNNDFFLEGEVQDPLRHRSIFEAKDYLCHSIKISSMKNLSEPLLLNCEDLRYFYPTPLDTLKGFMLVLPEISGSFLIEIELFAYGKPYFFQKKIIMSPKNGLDIRTCPLGFSFQSGRCQELLSCNALEKLEIIKNQGTWWIDAPISVNENWELGSLKDSKGCKWGCLEGFALDKATGLCTSIPRWEIGAWGECSAFCGGGFRSRSVSCKGEFCFGERPSGIENCNESSCCISTGDVVKNLKEPLPVLKQNKTLFCKQGLGLEKCPTAFQKQARCCSGLSVQRASQMDSCSPYQGGDCFICPDSIKEGSLCSGWQEVCF